MKKITRFSVLYLLPLFLGSCAPKVLTEIKNTHTPVVTANEVRLYEIGDSVPQSAELIGRVKVLDSGLSTHCQYDQVVALAKEKTAQSGGNALALTDHRKPSIWSSCHQIAGNMLLIDEAKKHEVYTRVATSVGDSKECNCEEQSCFRHNTFYANIGYSCIVSKFYMPLEATGHPKRGMDWMAGYDWVSKNGFGAGVMYSGYKSSYLLSDVDFAVKLTYIAPQFVMKQQFRQWSIEEKLGIGYFNYRESVKGSGSVSASGVGYNFLLGTEYHISDLIGIGANIGYVSGSLPEDKFGNPNEEDGSTGIFRLHFNVGVRFHF
ncbi:outer membrane protein [Phocaeicola sp.]|uniref:outer membrane protein n=1 Tax=Phocaeicola sp. TaxID=2773926 RepID=UPI003AB69983